MGIDLLATDDTSAPRSRNADGEFGWFVKGDWYPKENRTPYVLIPFRQFIELIPFVRRYFRFWRKQCSERKRMFIDTFRPLELQPIYGVPCGGLGSGSIGRGYRGEFCKFALIPGLVEHEIVWADQFIITVRRNGITEYQQALCGSKPPSDVLPSWCFNFPAENIDYRGLYPRSWSAFTVPNQGITMKCRQISPVYPNDYKDVSLPVTVFVWEISNLSDSNVSVSCTFTFRNGIGAKDVENEMGDCSSHFVQDDRMQCLLLQQTISDMPCVYAIAVLQAPNANDDGCDVSYRLFFDPNGSGSDIWNDLLQDGKLDPAESSANAKSCGIAISIKCDLAPGQKKEVPFCLAWDMPKIHFGQRQRSFYRYYSRFFKREPENAAALCLYAFENFRDWEERIDAWQAPTLENIQLPDWFKSALFNELYFMTDGGSTWLDFDENWAEQETHLKPYTMNLLRQYGRWAYLESWEYSDSVSASNPLEVLYHYGGEVAPVKTVSRVPHDFGNPAENPWWDLNAYRIHDTAEWRDLNLKFILTSYRDFIVLGKDEEFLNHVYPIVKLLIDVGLEKWDVDNDGIIENSNTCDQTYDSWVMNGTSAYCGSLWLAALRCAVLMGEILNDHEKAEEYRALLKKATLKFEEKLWNGKYYHFDEFSRSKHVIMADQLCGIWYAALLGIDDILPRDHVRQSLRHVYAHNVCAFANGRMGACNGFLPDYGVDRTCLQSMEVWSGVVYAVASHMLHEGMVEEAFHTASGVYQTCFERLGLQYQTPEAFYEKHWYRAIGYMRPLAIWAIQWMILERQKKSSCVKV